MNITLYFAPGACSFVPHAALEVAGAAYEPRMLNMREGDLKKPEFLTVNPHGQVPALTVDGVHLDQCVAICEFIAERYPDAGLLPAQPLQRAKARALFLYMNNSIHPCFTRFFRSALFAATEAGQADIKAVAQARYRSYMAELDEQVRAVATTAFLFGNQAGFADFYALTLYRWAGFAGIDQAAEFPQLAAYAQRVAAVPGVAAAMQREGIKLDTFKRA